MVAKVASTSACCFRWSPDHSSPSSSAVFTFSPGRRRATASASFSGLRFVSCSDRLPFFGAAPPLSRSRSFGSLCAKEELSRRPIRRVSSASYDGAGDVDGDEEEEFIRRIHELAAMQPQEGEEEEDAVDEEETAAVEDGRGRSTSFSPISHSSLGIGPFPSNWVPEHEQRRRKGSLCSSVLGGVVNRSSKDEIGETVCCSAKKAFSSMVFIIRELHTSALHLRELLYLEDLQGIIARVHAEMHASFCWLFQQIFSCTPTLMVSVMLLLANFTVYSMGHNVALASVPRAQYAAHTVSASSPASTGDNEKRLYLKFDAPTVKAVSSSSFSGRVISVGDGGGGGGRNARPVAGATDDGRRPPLNMYHHRVAVPGIGEPALLSRRGGDDGGPDEEAAVVVSLEEEAKAWTRTLDEAARMQAETRHEALMDHETLLGFVSPVTVEVEPDVGYPEYFRTDLIYQTAVNQEPSNPLLLSNYAQFLYQVAHDIDRAEDYFKRATEIKPADAEALSRYANFLWLAKNDLGAAEETYLEAIAADPGNTNHAANYAHFLWNTGGEDTCFMLEDGNDEDPCEA